MVREQTRRRIKIALNTARVRETDKGGHDDSRGISSSMKFVLWLSISIPTSKKAGDASVVIALLTSNQPITAYFSARHHTSQT